MPVTYENGEIRVKPGKGAFVQERLAREMKHIQRSLKAKGYETSLSQPPKDVQQLSEEELRASLTFPIPEIKLDLRGRNLNGTQKAPPPPPPPPPPEPPFKNTVDKLERRLNPAGLHLPAPKTDFDPNQKWFKSQTQHIKPIYTPDRQQQVAQYREHAAHRAALSGQHTSEAVQGSDDPHAERESAHASESGTGLTPTAASDPQPTTPLNDSPSPLLAATGPALTPVPETSLASLTPDPSTMSVAQASAGGAAVHDGAPGSAEPSVPPAAAAEPGAPGATAAPAVKTTASPITRRASQAPRELSTKITEPQAAAAAEAAAAGQPQPPRWQPTLELARLTTLIPLHHPLDSSWQKSPSPPRRQSDPTAQAEVQEQQ